MITIIRSQAILRTGQRFMTLLACVFAMLVTSSSFAHVKIMTATGEVELAESPQRVAVFDLGVLQNLQLLEVEVGAVTDKLYLPELTEQYGELPTVGNLFEPDMEALVNFNPDLIIVAARTAKHREALSEIAPTIDMTISGEAGFIEESMERFSALGVLFGKADKVAEVSARVADKLEQVNAATADKGGALFVLTSGQKISAFGKDSRFGWLHSDLGIPETIENVKEATHGEPISFEFIKANNPDWLLVFDRSAAIGKEGEAAKVLLDNPLVAETTAWKNDQVIYIQPAAYLAIGGILGIEAEIDSITKAFSK